MLADAALPLAVVAAMAGAREMGLLANTLFLAAGAAALSLPLGAALAFLLARTDLPGRRFLAGLLGALLVVPLYLQGGAWMAGFGLQGWWTAWQQQDWPVPLAGWRGAIWVHAVAAVPWVALLTGLGLAAAPSELEEETLLVGSPWQTAWRITWPHALPAVTVAAIWVALGAATEMSVTDLFQVRTYAEELYTQIAIGDTDAAGVSVVPGIALSAALVGGLWSAGRRMACWRLAAPPRRRVVFRLHKWRWPLAVLAAGLVFLCVGVPLINLVWKAGVEAAQGPEGLVRRWSAVKCASIVAASPGRCSRELMWSLWIGSTTATAALAAAAPLAWWARGTAGRAAVLLLAAGTLAALPGPAIGLALIELLNRPEAPWLVALYDRSILAPCAAQWVRAVPWATLVAWLAMESIPQALLDAAALDGAGPLAILRRVVWPQRRAALGAAWLAAFLVACGDLAASILVVPPGVTTLSIHIFGLLHYGVEDQVAGISLALVAGLLATAGIMAWLLRRGLSAVGA